MGTTIGADYCGQKQPHSAHTWRDPGVYGSIQIRTERQCAGITAEVAPGACWNDSGVGVPGLSDGVTYLCELRAGHAGAHECERNSGTAVWPQGDQL